MGSIVGMTTPQIMAWATAIASTGQKAEAAGTNVSKTMQMIEGAVANGGDILEKFAHVANMSSNQFAQAWEENASYAMLRFVGGLKRIEETGGSVDATLSDLKISSVRQKQSLEGLVQTYDVLVRALGEADEAWAGNNAAANEAIQKTEGFSGSLKILKQNLGLLGVDMADTLTPALKSLTGIVQGLVTAFEGMPPVVKGGLTVVGALMAGFGPVMTVVASLGQAWQGMQDKQAAALAAANKAVGKHSKSVDGLGAAYKGAATQAKLLTAASFGLKAALGGLVITSVVTAASLMASAIKNASDSKITIATQNQRNALDALANEYEQVAAASGRYSNEALALKGRLDAQTAAYESQKQTVGQLRQELQDLTERYNNTTGEHSSSLMNAESQAASLAWQLEQLRQIGDAWDGSNDSVLRAMTLVANLNSGIEGLGLTVDEETGKLNMSFDAVGAKIEEMYRKLTLEAEMEQFKAFSASIPSDMATLDKSLQQLNHDAESYLTTMGYMSSGRTLEQYGYGAAISIEELNKQIDDGTFSLEKWEKKVADIYGTPWFGKGEQEEAVYSAIAAYAKEREAYNANQEELGKLVRLDEMETRKKEALAKAVQYVTNGYGSAAEAAQKYSEITEDMTDEEREFSFSFTAAQVNDAVFAEQAAQLAEQKEAYDAMVDSIERANIRGVNFNDVLGSMGVSVESFASSLTSTGTSFEDFATQVGNAVDLVTNGRAKIEADESLSAEEIYETVRQNAEAYTEWAGLIVELSKTVGNEAGLAYLQALKDEGPGNAELLKQYLTPEGNEVFQETANAIAQATSDAVSAVTLTEDTLANAAGTVQALNDMQTAAENVSTSATTASADVDALGTSLGDVSTEAETAAADVTAAVDTMEAAIGTDLTTSVDTMKQTALSGFSDIDTAATEHAATMTGNYAQGITDGTPAVGESAAGITASVTAELDSLSSAMYTSGAHAVSQLAQGMLDNKYLSDNAAGSVAGGIEARLGFSEPETGPLHGFHKWMPDFLQGLARDIDKNAYLVRDSITKVAESMDLSRAARAEMRVKASEVDFSGQASQAVREYRQNSYDNSMSNVYNISIDGMSFNDDEQIKASALDLLVNLKRKAVMNVG